MKGSFSEEALREYARLATQSQSLEFSESGTYDFARCVRPDGTVYGTGGKCRKGTESEAKDKKVTPSSGQKPSNSTKPKRNLVVLGEGKESKVYDIGNNRVLKIGSAISKEGDEAHRVASDLGVAPKLLRSGKKGDVNYQVLERVQTKDIPGLPHPGTSNRTGAPLDQLNEVQMSRERDVYLAALKLNAKGVEHGDFHGGNMKWDEGRNKPVIMDYDNGKLNPKSAAKEAGQLLTTIGGRLESVGRYDEADDLYKMARQVSKKPTQGLFEEAQEMVSSYFPSSPDDL